MEQKVQSGHGNMHITMQIIGHLALMRRPKLSWLQLSPKFLIPMMAGRRMNRVSIPSVLLKFSWCSGVSSNVPLWLNISHQRAASVPDTDFPANFLDTKTQIKKLQEARNRDSPSCLRARQNHELLVNYLSAKETRQWGRGDATTCLISASMFKEWDRTRR